MTEGLSQTQLEWLMKPLHPARVKGRKQGSSTISYLEAYDVKATLIRIFGFGGFSAEVLKADVIRMEKDVPAFNGYGDKRTRRKDDDGTPAFNWSVTAMVTLKLTVPSLHAVYTETSAASQVGPDVGAVTDFAIKTAESDALKRCAVYLGTQFGLGLYDDGSKNEIVKVIVAPGQRWGLDEKKLPDEQAKQAASSLGLTTAERTPQLDASDIPLDSEDM